METFEKGQLISKYVNSPATSASVAVADIGMGCYLKMLLKDNFIHADLHPGNILVRKTDPNTRLGRLAWFFGVRLPPHLVLLDVGMTAELTPQDQRNLVGFFKVGSISPHCS